MARICAVIAIVLAPCPVIRSTPIPAPVGTVVSSVELPVSAVSTPRLVRAKRATAVTGRVAIPRVAASLVPPSHPPRRPLRATRSTLAARKPVRATRTAKTADVFADAPHTHAGLVTWSQRLPYPWPAIVHCESLRDDSWAESSGSMARGPFQFIRSTWRSLGLSGDPASYSWRYQFLQAKRLAARDGLRAWDCARILGLSS